MPLAHDKLAVLYRQLAQQLSVGLTLAQALRAPSPAPAGDCFRLAALAESGRPVAELLAEAGGWLPKEDRPFLRVGAASGRLPVVLANLADRHEQLGITKRRVLIASVYPLGVFHFGALILPLLRMIDFERGLVGDACTYLLGLGSILGPAWGGALLLWVLLRRGNPLARALLDLLPAIGGYRRHRELADFAFALGNLLEAGAPIGAAWRDAGEIARAPRLRRAAEEIEARVEQGLSPGAHLKETRAFPHEFVARYQTGEATGSLEATMLALAVDHGERAKTRLAAATMLYPGLLFAAVAAMVAYMVFGFVLKYVNTLNSLMDT
jgi:type II secretory pathway component PulF